MKPMFSVDRCSIASNILYHGYTIDLSISLRKVRLSVYTKFVTKPVYNVCGKIHGEIEPGIPNFRIKLL